ncbi:hypothetical protein OBBRIDRAFT_789176 [Obba rivulosa]|uniref:Thioesterase domain-containing protein n=1 Tax=Obba rivulosa TaxID=1052685 RepID=A0A8E2J4B4_9APHY|nr:hypothetical protein OBBRIDRAFT_789176 [Obba rivulosa]
MTNQSGSTRKYHALGKKTQGNLADKFRERVAPYQNDDPDFEISFWNTLIATEMSMHDRTEDGKKQAKGVFELTVDRNMVNRRGNMHGGCIATLIDLCTSFVLVAALDVPQVSQVLTTLYHAPVPIDAKLRVVCETTSMGRRANSIRCEVWDVTNTRLAATGIHIKMTPSPSKL